MNACAFVFAIEFFICVVVFVFFSVKQLSFQFVVRIETAGVCSVCGATNGPSLGCVSVTVAGQELSRSCFIAKTQIRQHK